MKPQKLTNEYPEMCPYEKENSWEDRSITKERFFITIKGHAGFFYDNEYEARMAFNEFLKNKVDVELFYRSSIKPLNLSEVPTPEEMTVLDEVNELLGSKFRYIKPEADAWNTDYELFIRKLLLKKKKELSEEKSINEMVEFI